MQRALAFPAVAISLFALFSTASAAQTSAPSATVMVDLVRPYSIPGGMAIGPHNHLYGASLGSEGATGYGEVFDIMPKATGGYGLRPIFRFPNAVHVTTLAGTVVVDPIGNVFGATRTGEVFELSPPAVGQASWHKYTLYENAQRLGPYVFRRADGVLLDAETYDVSGGGFVSSIFALQPPVNTGGAWIKQNIVTAPPHIILQEIDAADSRGNLFGVGFNNSTNQYVIFEFSPPAAPAAAWTSTVICELTAAMGPTSRLVVDRHDNLFFGQNVSGDVAIRGHMVELTAPIVAGSAWISSIIHTFYFDTLAHPGGQAPGDISMDVLGNLYGASGNGSTSQDSGGTIWRLSAPKVQGGAWSFKILLSLTQVSPFGWSPEGVQVSSNGKVFVENGIGGGSGWGVVLQIIP